MRFDFEVPSFTGFYQGIWDQGENEYNEVSNLEYGDHPDIRSLNHIDDWGFVPDYRDKVAQLFAERYVGVMKEHLGIELDFLGGYVRSPKEYNFTTDEIYAIVDIPDYDALVEKLSSIASNPKYRTRIAELIKQHHTGYDGFISFMSNNIEDWFGLILDPNNSVYMSCFMGYVLDAICPEEIEELNETIYSYVIENTDFHCVEPETDEAKEENELYEKYGNFYTEYAKEHPMRHLDPDRPGYYTVDDWDDYKEDFLEVAAKHEEELKRKAALAAQPIIPGLFDDETNIPTP